MNRAETTAVMTVLKTAYPRSFTNMTRQEAEDTIQLWHTMLEEYPAKYVNAAVKSLIATNQYLPSIA